MFSPSVVLGVAAATGALDRAGLTIELIPATSSAQQFGALLAGKLDAALTSPDNVLAYRGSAVNPLGRTVDVRILAAVDRGLGLSLFAGPGLDPDNLRGGVLAVDVPGSGFAFVAYELLARRGLRAGADYEVRPLGSTPRRAAALLAGECTMTVLNAGSDLRAEAGGCRRLNRASVLGPYVGTVLAAPGAPVAASRASLRTLTELLVETSRALLDGELAAEAAAVTADRLGLDETDVRRYLDTLADPAEGLVPDGRLDDASLQTLSWLRRRHGSPGGDLSALIGPGSDLVDDRFLPTAAP
jgi:ABC-type nitrate/sulfonate/bicarbonate transport system substrate-binding protein